MRPLLLRDRAADRRSVTAEWFVTRGLRQLTETSWWRRWPRRTEKSVRRKAEEERRLQVSQDLYRRIALVSVVFEGPRSTGRFAAAWRICSGQGQWARDTEFGPMPDPVAGEVLGVLESAYALPAHALSDDLIFPRSTLEAMRFSAPRPRWYSAHACPPEPPLASGELDQLDHRAHKAIVANILGTIGFAMIPLAFGALLVLGGIVALSFVTVLLALVGVFFIAFTLTSGYQAIRDQVRLLRLDRDAFTDVLQQRLHMHIGSHLQELVKAGADTTELARVLCHTPTITYATLEALTPRPHSLLQDATHGYPAPGT